MTLFNYQVLEKCVFLWKNVYKMCVFWKNAYGIVGNDRCMIVLIFSGSYRFRVSYLKS